VLGFAMAVRGEGPAAMGMPPSKALEGDSSTTPSRVSNPDSSESHLVRLPILISVPFNQLTSLHWHDIRHALHPRVFATKSLGSSAATVTAGVHPAMCSSVMRVGRRVILALGIAVLRVESFNVGHESVRWDSEGGEVRVCRARFESERVGIIARNFV
jgi:hypothetical protein